MPIAVVVFRPLSALAVAFRMRGRRRDAHRGRTSTTAVELRRSEVPHGVGRLVGLTYRADRRENARAAGPQLVSPGHRGEWDGRFGRARRHVGPAPKRGPAALPVPAGAQVGSRRRGGRDPRLLGARAEVPAPVIPGRRGTFRLRCAAGVHDAARSTASAEKDAQFGADTAARRQVKPTELGHA